MSKRFALRFVRPAARRIDGVAYEEIQLGDDKPAYILVLRGGRASETAHLSHALSDSPAAEKLVGSPVIAIPEGAEFEVWEVE